MEPEMGEWWAISKSDSRWNCAGVGMMVDHEVPEAAESALRALEAKLGEDQPHDIKIAWWRNSTRDRNKSHSKR